MKQALRKSKLNKLKAGIRFSPSLGRTCMHYQCELCSNLYREQELTITDDVVHCRECHRALKSTKTFLEYQHLHGGLF